MKVYIHSEIVQLECGAQLPHLEIAYSTFGTLNEDASNVIWVCHALSGNSDVSEWWSGIVGKGKYLDPDRYFIICANVIGSCYGSTGPTSAALPESLKGHHFPLITVKDMVKAHQLLANHLNIQHIHALIGPSLGGQQALQWAALEPNRFSELVLIATNAEHSPYGIAFNESQRLALWADETFRSNLPEGGKYGLKAARSIALLSYRHYLGYLATQKDEFGEKIEYFKASSYQVYQGEKFVDRFNPYSYWSLSKAMDSHHLGRGEASLHAAIAKISIRTLVVGVSSDILFPIEEQQFLAQQLPYAVYAEITSDFGHDGFLVEFDQLNKILSDFRSGQLRKQFTTTLKSLTTVTL
ncbi:MAG: homoserine O-acetyltransferase [Crocinitomicaceae bacterium]|nr:homoserine O-acetyltransferase [Crocinitomicaceae bacterium]